LQVSTTMFDSIKNDPRLSHFFNYTGA
jgi:hypothetical protein